MAKWKRWAREFLDPDPLGGLQSGYARQFSYEDAFRVYLGGSLVGDLKFTVPEAGRILSDLDSWLKKNGYYAWSNNTGHTNCLSNHVYIYRVGSGTFVYAVHCLTNEAPLRDGTVSEEHYTLKLLGVPKGKALDPTATHASVIFIDRLHQSFLEKISSAE